MATSLGTLTLDLIAKIGGFTGPLDKASASVKKNAKEIDAQNAALLKSFANLGTGIGVAIGGLAVSIPTVLAGIVVSSANAAKEITKLSSLAGLGTTEFQKYAAGAATVGVEQDKLSDILKDVNDKVGDFLQTGAGPLADFFTNIAPKVGLTADNFKKLNSADALQLYVSSLQKANASQKEMTFYLEAIANDATGLLPLLQDNGKAWQELGAQAEAAGAILDTKTIAAAKEFSNELLVVNQYIDGAKTALAAEFMPVLAQFTKDLATSTKEAGGLRNAVGEFADGLVTSTAFIINAGDATVRTFQLAANVLVGLFGTAAGHLLNLASQANTALGFISFGETSDKFKKDAADFANSAQLQFGVAREAAAAISADLEKPLAGDRFKQYVADAKAAAAQLKTIETVAPGAGTGVDPAAIKAAAEAAKKAASDAASAAKKIDDTFKSTETDLMRQIELINTSTDATKNATQVQKLAFEIQSGKLVGINALQQERLNTLASELDALNKLKQANEDNAKAAAFAASLRDQNATARNGFEQELAGAGSGDKLKERLKQDLAIQQDYNQQVMDLQKQLNGGDITKELYDQETALLEEALAERMILQQDYYNQLDEAQANWIDGVTSAWENYRDTATDYQQQAADATSTILADTTSAVAESIDGLLRDTMSIGDATKNILVGIANSVVDAIEQMIAQWLVYQAVQLVAGKATQASAATSLIANAQATAFQASLAAFASTAAIPIVGPIVAPAAAAAAASFAAPLVAGVATAALSGMAHDGIDSVPQTGTWLLEKGERVTTAETSAKLDKTLDDVKTNGKGGSQVNIIEDASKAGQTRTRLDSDGIQEVIDVWIYKLNSDDDVMQALNRKTGARAVGT
jgi:lambda family phage tail tape measure protein